MRIDRIDFRSSCLNIAGRLRRLDYAIKNGYHVSKQTS